MMEKVEVNGAEASPVFTHLKGTSRGAAFLPSNPYCYADITWNFSSKFLVARDGLRVERFDRADPVALVPYIERLLDAVSATAAAET
jgi:glutathione peroxidase-family protein